MVGYIHVGGLHIMMGFVFCGVNVKRREDTLVFPTKSKG